MGALTQYLVCYMPAFQTNDFVKSGCPELALKTQIIMGEVVGNKNWDCEESTYRKQTFLFSGKREGLGLEDSEEKWWWLVQIEHLYISCLEPPKWQVATSEHRPINMDSPGSGNPERILPGPNIDVVGELQLVWLGTFSSVHPGGWQSAEIISLPGL